MGTLGLTKSARRTIEEGAGAVHWKEENLLTRRHPASRNNPLGCRQAKVDGSCVEGVVRLQVQGLSELTVSMLERP